MLSYLKAVPGELAHLLLAVISATLANLLMFYAGWYAWELFGATHTAARFAELDPETYRLLGDIVALTPYWQNAAQLALTALLGTFVVTACLQLLGLRRRMIDPLPLPLKLLWVVGLTLLLSWPLARFDSQLDAWQAYAGLLLPGMLCVQWPVLRTAGRLVPDLTMLLARR